jgi:hypothetical protein
MQRSPEMIRELLRGVGEEAVDMKIMDPEDYYKLDMTDDDFVCEFYFNIFF